MSADNNNNDNDNNNNNNTNIIISGSNDRYHKDMGIWVVENVDVHLKKGHSGSCIYLYVFSTSADNK